MADLSDYWPKAVAHLAKPLSVDDADEVTVAEISEAPVNGYRGFRKATTALVPIDRLDDVLKHPGGIGHEVQSWGPMPCVREGQTYSTSFWIDGRKGTDERFETFVQAWSRHNRDVQLPDNIFLMTYGLVPRYLSDGVVCWDDPHGPVYDVVRVKSHIDWDNKPDEPLSFISVRRDYLEDYCHLKQCAAVQVYYEERFSADDKTFGEALRGEEGAEFHLPGRLLDMGFLTDSYHGEAPQMSRVWGARLLLKPERRPITDAEDPELVWPGDTVPMTYQIAASKRLYGYVRDEVLQQYQGRAEYQIHPDSGGVNYGGWWATSRTHRVGRNHIRVELKKLYEGCPPHVISHWHKFAVPESIANRDKEQHGTNNIAERAHRLIDAFLSLTATLQQLSEELGLGFSQVEIGSLSTEEVAYIGWWKCSVAESLFAVAPLAMTREQFLERALAVVKLIELLKPGPLRTMALKLGVPKEAIKDFQSLKLLACLCQLANIAREEGFHLLQDASLVVPKWQRTLELPSLVSLFAVQGLRIAQAHTPGSNRDASIASAASRLGIDVAAMAGGWGYAVDTMYDCLARDLEMTDHLLSATFVR
ncbi:MAG: hypothetical protein IPK02_21390 [Candidatus Accumulibacter sp.]|uniref:Uncharacterized protein n=1 Tax=Candidatus Accumulibacter affinis TaxID=2954384 RepID=A0A935W8F4_9PROT|nr:hypothetical protein [Candidatus Accumulibacter affinis]